MEQIPPHLRLTREIRSNDRFAAFEGHIDGRQVFIKFAVAPETRKRLTAEAAGLDAMRALDPSESMYRVPHVIELTDTYVATEWAEGRPMKEDFDHLDLHTIESDIDYLVKLYTFIDRATTSTSDHSKINEQAVEKHEAVLQRLHYEEFIDATLAVQTADYIRAQIPSIETRPTNGDLQPGNLMVSSGATPTVVDCESYATSWPRHYSIVNFVFNYAIEHPSTANTVHAAITRYCDILNIDPQRNVDAFNVSAAIRSLQIVEERLSGGTIAPDVKQYVEHAMQNIINHRLFIGE